MDSIRTVTPQDLDGAIGAATSPTVIDVRSPEAFDADDVQIVGAIRRRPDAIADAEFGHVGARGSFDAFPRLFDIIDPALGRLALIVRGADAGRPELTPQLPGLLALSQGLSATIADDHEMLAHGMVADDALYAWCRSQDRPSTAV